jgi:hypothetical protein
MEVRAIKMDDSGSVLVSNGEFNLWVDIWEDSSGELTADWNKYIFYLWNEQDVKEREFMADCNNFIEFKSVAIDYYELMNAQQHGTSN